MKKYLNRYLFIIIKKRFLNLRINKLKFCIAGKNNIAVNALDYLINELHFSKENIFVVINKTDSGVNLWQKSLKNMHLIIILKLKH